MKASDFQNFFNVFPILKKISTVKVLTLPSGKRITANGYFEADTTFNNRDKGTLLYQADQNNSLFFHLNKHVYSIRSAYWHFCLSSAHQTGFHW